MTVPKVWEIVRAFKRECELKGWKVSEHEDWVKAGGEYHNFLWARTVLPAAFKRITCEKKCAIKQGVDYKVVDVAYTAWLFSDPPPEVILQTIAAAPELADRTAVYDLSWVHTEKPLCLRINHTRSGVFEEFENFLERKWGVKFKTAEDLIAKAV